MRKQNSLDWFHETYCVDCDRPRNMCTMRPLDEVACILAAILKKLSTQGGVGDVHQEAAETD